MILYAGNILSKFGFTPTFIEQLTPKLSKRYEIKSVSEKKNQGLRLLDMISVFMKNRKKIRLVMIDSYSRRAFWYTYILARLCNHYKVSYIPLLRGGGYPDRLKESPSLCRFIFSNSAVNISPSFYLKKHFEDAGFQVDYIPNFIPIENYPFKKRSKIRPKLFWVRSFHEIYNPVLAIEILSRLKKKYPDAELCMVGPDKDGSIEKVKAKALTEGVSDSLKLTGKLSKEEWIKLSSEYDIFINTTDFDNHPVSVIEAMAAGLPVISTDVGGLPYLINNNTDGVLVPPGDPDKFVIEIDRLIKDAHFTEMISVNARKKVEEFDWEIVKIKWFDVIDKIVCSKTNAA